MDLYPMGSIFPFYVEPCGMIMDLKRMVTDHASLDEKQPSNIIQPICEVPTSSECGASMRAWKMSRQSSGLTKAKGGESHKGFSRNPQASLAFWASSPFHVRRLLGRANCSLRQADFSGELPHICGKSKAMAKCRAVNLAPRALCLRAVRNHSCAPGAGEGSWHV